MDNSINVTIQCMSVLASGWVEHIFAIPTHTVSREITNCVLNRFGGQRQSFMQTHDFKKKKNSIVDYTVIFPTALWWPELSPRIFGLWHQFKKDTYLS